VLPPALFSSVAVKSVSVRRNSPLPATGSVFDRLIIVVSGREDACPTGSRLVPAAEELAAIQRDYLAGWDDYIDELQPKDASAARVIVDTFDAFERICAKLRQF